MGIMKDREKKETVKERISNKQLGKKKKKI